MLRVLLSAYSLDPDGGSELTVGWNRTLQAARTARVWTLTEDRGQMDRAHAALARAGVADRVTLLPIAHTPFERRLMRAGLFYVAYERWQSRLVPLARRLHREVGFDAVHHANLVGFREPGELWRLGLPFVLGPVGGTQNYPPAFLWRTGWKSGFRESVRTALNRYQVAHGWRFHAAARRATTVLAANTTAQRDLRRVGVEARLLLETGTGAIGGARRWADRRPGPLRVLWSGETGFRKGVDLIVDAHRVLQARGVPVHLTVLGNGPMAGVIPAGDPTVHAPGWVPRADAIAATADADVFAFTSLRDTSGNVVLEAMAAGLPVVFLDHQGVHDMVPPAAGWSVAVTTPARAVADLADALAAVGADPALYDAKSRAAVDRARALSWDANGDAMDRIYHDAVWRHRLVPHPRPDAATLHGWLSRSRLSPAGA